MSTDNQFSEAVLRVEKQPWDMQPGESTRAYEAFVIYRDLGASRTLQQVANCLSLSFSRIAQISRANRWKERTRAWSQEQDHLWQEELAEHRRNIFKKYLSLAEVMRGVAYQRLRALIGDPDQPDLAALEQIQLKDIPRLAAVACEIERAVFGTHMHSEEAPREIHITVLEEDGPNRPGSDEPQTPSSRQPTGAPSVSRAE